MRTPKRLRVFKTPGFSKDAKKAGITDSALCAAVAQVQAGQADDLGGGVFKKRLKDNQQRAIVLAKGGQHWFYAYLFAKNSRSNINDNELVAFRLLARSYAALTPAQLDALLAVHDLQEICHAPLQE
jgi:hypothetical protein